MSQVTRQLLDLGVQPGGCCWYTAPFSRWLVEDGPEGLIAALWSALGWEGTLVMPSMTADDDHPFDRATSFCIGMASSPRPLAAAGRTAQRQPARLLAAAGPQAARITAPHPVDVPHGLDSPVGRVYELGQEAFAWITPILPSTWARETRANVRKKYVTLL